MPIPFLRGEAIISNGTATLPAMTLDFDVVSEIANEIERSTGLRPRLVSRTKPAGWITETDNEAPLDQLSNMGKSQRNTLMLSASSVEQGPVEVIFIEQSPLTVHAPQHTELVGRLAQYLLAEGRVRLVWMRLLPALPLLAALAFTVLSVLSITVESPGILVASTWIVLVLIVCGAAIWTANRLRRNTRTVVRGAKFREVSRADFRDRVTNLRAGAAVALIFTPLGAVVGWALNTWLGR